jgi:hypothetical protein
VPKSLLISAFFQEKTTLPVIYRAQPPLEFIPPAFQPWFLAVVHFLLPTWLRWKTAINQIEADNVEVLVNLYRQFQEGKIRFLMAFRHPQIQDPLCLGYLLSQIVPRVAQKMGVRLQRPIHAHLVYDLYEKSRRRAYAVSPCGLALTLAGLPLG